MEVPGNEPATSWSEVRHADPYTNEAIPIVGFKILTPKKLVAENLMSAKVCQPTAKLTRECQRNELNEYLIQYRGEMWSVSNPLEIASFLDRNYRHKSVATQILYDIRISHTLVENSSPSGIEPPPPFLEVQGIM